MQAVNLKQLIHLLHYNYLFLYRGGRQLKILKKGLILLLLTFTTISFSGELEKFLYNFTPETMLESNSDELRYMGNLINKWKNGYEPIKNPENLNLNYTKQEKVVINFLENMEQYVFISPLKKLEAMKEENSDSLIFNSFYLFLGSEYWINTGDPSYAKKMFETADKIEKMYGKKVPLTIYYNSYILWYSNLYGDKTKAFNNIKYGFLNFEKEKKILELYIIMAYDRDYFEYLDRSYEEYMSFNEKNPDTLLTLSKSYRKTGNREKAINIAKYVINNYTSTYRQRDAYEILGDLAEKAQTKIDYYKQASSLDPENWMLLRKLGLAYYNQNPDENAQIARVILNMSISKNPNQPEVEKVLEVLRKDVIIDNIIKYVIPIVGVFILGIFLLLRYEKKKKKKEKDMIYKESRNDHNDHNEN